MSFIHESVIYNIYPLGYCGAPKENDHVQSYRLDKVLDSIEHFRQLGVNAVLFNPVFESSRHGYDTIDYRRIDCRLGDNESFKKICDPARGNIAIDRAVLSRLRSNLRQFAVVRQKCCHLDRVPRAPQRRR